MNLSERMRKASSGKEANMKNHYDYYLTNMLRGPIVHIDILKNGGTLNMPEDKNRPHLYNPLLAQMPDALVMPSPPYGGTFRVVADAKLQQKGAAAIGCIALVDFEHGIGKATLREHLPRALGTVVGHYGNMVDVRMGCDPYSEVRKLQKVCDEKHAFLLAAKRDLAVSESKRKELEEELGEAFDQLNNEKLKRAADVRAYEAAEKRAAELTERIKTQAKIIGNLMPRTAFDPLRSYSFPIWASTRLYSDFPTLLSFDLTLPKPVPHIVEHGGTRSLDCPDVYPSAEAAQKAIAANPKRFLHPITAWQAVPYEAPKTTTVVVPAPKLEPLPQWWTTGDGGRVEITKMTDSHLFFALAKGRRGEYQDARCRALGVKALEKEAVRRLAPAGAGSSITAEEVAQLKREAEYERDRRLQMGHTNARLNCELEATKNALKAANANESLAWDNARLKSEAEKLRKEISLLNANLKASQDLAVGLEKDVANLTTKNLNQIRMLESVPFRTSFYRGLDLEPLPFPERDSAGPPKRG